MLSQRPPKSPQMRAGDRQDSSPWLLPTASCAPSTSKIQLGATQSLSRPVSLLCHLFSANSAEARVEHFSCC